MTNVQGSVHAEGRLRWLSDRLDRDGSVLISDAAQELDVSEMTIRRDLAELEERGAARRVRGGATAIGPEPFARRRETATRAKGQIAAKLAGLIPHQGAVGFDASSTVMRLASGLDKVRDLTIITNGPDTFSALQGIPGVSPLLSGGALDLRTGSLVGPLACRSVEQFAVDVMFASAAAVTVETGALEATLEEAEVKRCLAAGAQRVVLAVDASKLGGRAIAVGLDWERIDLLVTELDPDDRRLQPYRSLVDVR